jgi:hypothetical protein
MTNFADPFCRPQEIIKNLCLLYSRAGNTRFMLEVVLPADSAGTFLGNVIPLYENYLYSQSIIISKLFPTKEFTY